MNQNQMWNYTIKVYTATHIIHGLAFLVIFYAPIWIFSDYTTQDSLTMLLISICASLAGYMSLLFDMKGFKARLALVFLAFFLLFSYQLFEATLTDIFLRHKYFTIAAAVLMAILGMLVFEVAPLDNSSKKYYRIKKYTILLQSGFLILPVLITIMIWHIKGLW